MAKEDSAVKEVLELKVDSEVKVDSLAKEGMEDLVEKDLADTAVLE